MPDFLRKIPFTEELLGAVENFECGGEPWQRPLAQWIKAAPKVKNGALYEMRKRKGRLQVWLHVNQQDELVGYSSLGASNWEWPKPNDPRIPINLIPNVAIQRRFWGKPDDPPRYSTQIMEHLVFEARQHPDRQPLLGLYVDPRNEPAIRLYERTGFKKFHHTCSADEEGAPDYISMILKLEDYSPPATSPPAA